MYGQKRLIILCPEACIIKLITAVIYGFHNMLVFVPKHQTKLERLAGDKRSSLLRKFVIYGQKSFIILVPVLVSTAKPVIETSHLVHPIKLFFLCHYCCEKISQGVCSPSVSLYSLIFLGKAKTHIRPNQVESSLASGLV